MELELLKKNLSCSDARALSKLVDHDHPELSVVAVQTAGASTIDALRWPISIGESALRLMARIDVLYLEDPCSDSCGVVDDLAREGIPSCRDRSSNLMPRMGLQVIYQHPRTTVPGDPSAPFPCLVDLKEVYRCGSGVGHRDHPYPTAERIPLPVATVDLFSRHVVSWKPSNSLDTEFCLDVLEMALSGGR